MALPSRQGKTPRPGQHPDRFLGRLLIAMCDPAGSAPK